jgi:hypothetical protein
MNRFCVEIGARNWAAEVHKLSMRGRNWPALGLKTLIFVLTARRCLGYQRGANILVLFMGAVDAKVWACSSVG